MTGKQPKIYCVRISNPTEIEYAPIHRYAFTSGAKGRAVGELSKFTDYLGKYDHAGLAQQAALIAEIDNLSEQAWAATNPAAPMEWSLDMSWTRLMIRLWKEQTWK